MEAPCKRRWSRGSRSSGTVQKEQAVAVMQMKVGQGGPAVRKVVTQCERRWSRGSRSSGTVQIEHTEQVVAAVQKKEEQGDQELRHCEGRVHRWWPLCGRWRSRGSRISGTVQVEQIKKLVATIWRRRSSGFRSSATGRTGGGHQAGKKD